MCGIAGYVLDKVPQNIEIIDKKIIHRGVDDFGNYKAVFNNKFICFFHRRLSIYDLSDNASQPMKSYDGKYIITFNGAIYNYKDLWFKLTGEKENTQNSDTRVLSEIISKWDTLKSWSEINGMFAAAVLDKENGKVKLARDRAGQKPLFYSINPKINGEQFKGIIYSSEIKSLSSIIETSFDDNYIKKYLLQGKVDSTPETIFKEIKRLDPSYELSFDIETNQISFNPFWNLSKNVSEIIKKEDSNTILEKTKIKINNSVNLQITGDRKLGLMLSSGVDSTVIASLMRKNTAGEIFSFTYDFENFTNGESYIARKTSKKLNLNFIESDPISSKFIKRNLIDIILHQDEPITSIRTVAQHYVHKIAASQDCRILIEGNGGDEIFGGYEHYEFARLLDKISNYKIDTKYLLQSVQDEKISDLLIGLRSVLIPGLCSKDATEVRKLNAINEEIKEGVIEYKYRLLQKCFQQKNSYTINSQLNDLLSVFLPRSLRYVDRASMASGNEARAPLLDHNVIEYGIASSVNNSFDSNKREVLRSMASKDILDLTGINKKTIVDPQREWFYNDLFDWLLEIIYNSKDELSRYYKFEILIKNIFEEKENWNKYKKGNSGPFMQAINLAILLKNCF